MNKIKRIIFSLVFAMSAFALGAQDVVYYVTGADSFGDGWNGASINFVVNGAVEGSYNGPAAAGPESASFVASAGDMVDFQWANCGTFPGEVIINIVDQSGASVASIQGGCVVGASIGSFPLAAPASAASACPMTITKEDSFGDGWNGSALEIVVDGNSVAVVTLPGGAGPANCDIDVPDGSSVDVNWINGSFQAEISFTIDDPTGNEIANVPTGGAAGFLAGDNIVSFSPVCPAPCGVVCPMAGSGTFDTEYFLAAGECSAIVTFPVEIVGNCIVPVETINGFTGPFAPELAGNNLNNVTDAACEAVTETTINLATSALPGPANSTTCDLFFGSIIEWAAPSAGIVTFDWSVSNPGANAEPIFGYSVASLAGMATGANLTGNVVPLGNADGDAGTTSITVADGEFISFVAYTLAGGSSIFAEVVNFSFTSFEPLAAGPVTAVVEVGIGENQTATYEFTDIEGVTHTCSIEVDVFPFDDDQVSDALSCNDDINVSVDENCEVSIGADMFLEGGPYACYDDYEVYIRPFGGNSYLDGLTAATNGLDINANTLTLSLPNGQHIYEVFDPRTGNTCWGYFTIEDKFAPSLECECPVGGDTTFPPAAQTLGGDDPTVDLSSFGANCGVAIDLDNAGTATFYDTYVFTVDTDGNYTFEINSQWNDASIFLYQGAFDPSNICTNAIAADNDSGAGFDPLLTVPLTAGTVYTLVVSSWGQGQAGPYELIFTGDVEFNAELVVGIFAEECSFLCYDETNWEIIDNLPTPSIVDNCGSGKLVSTDTWIDGDCGERLLFREWSVTDPNNTNAAPVSCTQQFVFASIGAGDLTLPPALVELNSCGGDSSPEGVAAALGMEFAYPFYTVGDKALDEDDNVIYVPRNVAVTDELCQLFVSYSDLNIPACGDDCPGLYKVIRNWTILDWCANTTTPYQQIIKATDSEAPTIEVEDVTVSVSPWGCQASFMLPCPDKLKDNCVDKGFLTYEVYGPAGVTVFESSDNTCDVNGVTHPKYNVVGAPKGVHSFVYAASDCCGNVGLDTVFVSVVDGTPPVAIAKENIVLSLTSAPGSDDGIAKMYPESVDNGSHDGDCGDVYLEIRRDDGAAACGNIGNNGHNNNETFNGDGQVSYPNYTHPFDDRDDTDGGAFVKFCCDDISEENGGSYDAANDIWYAEVKVWLRVWDDGNMDGVYGSATDLNGDGDSVDAGEHDNYSDTWAIVRIENKLPAQLIPPADVTIKCEYDYTDLSVTGVAEASGTCHAASVVYEDKATIDACGAGVVERVWCIDGTSICATQYIQIDYVSDWDPCDNDRGIVWPADYTGSGEDPQDDSWCNPRNIERSQNPFVCEDDDTGMPEWTDSACDLVGYSLDSDTFYFEADACYKVLNYWSVINWCLYNPGDADWNNVFNESNDNDADGIPNLYDLDDNDNGEIDDHYQAVGIPLIDDASNPFVGFPEVVFTLNSDGVLMVNSLVDAEDTGLGYFAWPVSYDYSIDIWDLVFANTDSENYTGVFNPNLEDDGIADGLYTHLQVIKYIDEEKPEIIAPDSCFAAQSAIVEHPYPRVNSTPAEDEDGELSQNFISLDCSNFAKIKATGFDTLSDCQSAWLKWQVLVDVWNDWEYEYEVSSFVPVDPSSGLWDDDNSNGIPDLSVENLTGDQGTANGDMLMFETPEPIDGSKTNHRVLWKLTDGCGNVTTFTSYFTVEDKKAPTPYCVNLSTAVMENGEVELWACDFNQGSFDNCTHPDWLRYTFTNVAPESDPDYDPSTRCSSRTFTCDDIATSVNGVVQVQMYVWDECGNSDFCMVNLKLVDNQEACPDNPSATRDISGHIMTECDNPVTGVMVSVTDQNGFDLSNMTSSEGEYMFENNEIDVDYMVSVEKDIEWLDGVTTLDLVKIQRHILGIEDLSTAYKLIAADANNDANVSAIDLVKLRKLILGVETEIAENDSWRFADASQTLDINNPYGFDEEISLEDLAENMMEEDFVGIKVGDVNCSNSMNFNSDNVSTRTAQDINFNIDALNYTNASNVVVEVTAENFNDVYGFQFTMDNSGLELVNVVSGAIEVTMDNFGKVGNQLTSSWNSVDGVSTTDVLFTLEFTSNTAGNTNSLTVNSDIASAQAYVGTDLNIVNVVLSNTDLSTTYALNQNEPNPFSDRTVISFVLPTDDSATLKVLDVTGKVLRTVTGNYNAGLNKIEIFKKELSTSGVLYYQIQSGDYTATKKMIILD